jgi:hypothetical protein
MMGRNQEVDLRIRTLKDLYEHCVVEKGMNDGRGYHDKMVTYLRFVKIIVTFFRVVYDRVIYKGEDVVLPYQQGTIMVRKVMMIRKPRFISKTVNNLTEYIPLIFWDRPKWAIKYRMKIPRSVSRDLFKYFYEGNDYPETEDYEFFHRRYSQEKKD